MLKKAVILFSGGLDSATILAIAKKAGYECHAMSFDYGQKHAVELEVAKNLTDRMNCSSHRIIKIDPLALTGSSLTDLDAIIEKNRMELDSSADPSDIPSTYVPARNTLFLSFALAYAENIEAEAIYIGANALDYSGYPDCRPEFFEAFEKMANLATKRSINGSSVKIETPLLFLSKAEIIRLGNNLDVDYALTHSCYDPVGGLACGSCDSCILRRRGFIQAGCPDVTRYAESDQWKAVNNSKKHSSVTAVL